MARADGTNEIYNVAVTTVVPPSTHGPRYLLLLLLLIPVLAIVATYRLAAKRQDTDRS